jgi:hypothetical protein
LFKIYEYAEKKGHANPLNLMRLLYNKKYQGTNKKHIKVISNFFKRKLAKGNIKTNEAFLKYYKKVPEIYKTRFLNKKYPGLTSENAVKKILSKRNRDASREPAARKIQKVYSGYFSKTLHMITNLISDMGSDGRFKNNVKVLSRLVERINAVIKEINNKGEAHSTITTLIGPCHINANEVPRKYLSSMYNQLKYVSNEYNSFSKEKKKKYLDELSDKLGERPCLENLLDGMADAIATSAFEWRGKSKMFEVSPLLQNNERYLTRLIGPAISSWYSSLSRNNKKSLDNKDLNTRKKMFWNMIKSRNISIMTNNGPVYSTPKNYNVNGKRFFASNEANALGNF